MANAGMPSKVPGSKIELRRKVRREFDMLVVTSRCNIVIPLLRQLRTRIGCQWHQHHFIAQKIVLLVTATFLLCEFSDYSMKR